MYNFYYELGNLYICNNYKCNYRFQFNDSMIILLYHRILCTLLCKSFFNSKTYLLNFSILRLIYTEVLVLFIKFINDFFLYFMIKSIIILYILLLILFLI